MTCASASSTCWSEINLLREGLDLPEVAFIGILDADKEGYLRGFRSLIQTIGRASRNLDGHVVMYADTMSEAMRQAMGETDRRRAIQTQFQRELTESPPNPSSRPSASSRPTATQLSTRAAAFQESAGLPPDELLRLARDVEKEMKRAARDLEFERAAQLRDRLTEIRRRLDGRDGPSPEVAGARPGRNGRPRHRPTGARSGRP